jgi:hypothetical protein
VSVEIQIFAELHCVQFLYAECHCALLPYSGFSYDDYHCAED